MPVGFVHEVTLDYAQDASGNQRVRQPPTVIMRKGEKIHFTRGAIPGGIHAAIIFNEPQFFSQPTFDEGQPAVELIVDLPHRTTYKCGLKANGQLIPGTLSGPSDGGPGGGDIDPPPELNG